MAEDGRKSLNEWADYIVDWRKRKGFNTGWDNLPEKLMLLVSEASEALESDRHGVRTDADVKPPCPTCGFHVSPVGEEIADAFIRLADLAGSLGIDLDMEVEKKMAANEGRPYKHGKRY